MCGIAGIINYQEKPIENIKTMNQKMFHRGPDAGDFFIDDDARVVLGHRRLSILDLSENGAQPMKSADGRWIISYNGEIYNHKELLLELKKSGAAVHLRGSSDTEILLEAVAYWGIFRTLRFVKGMFAIALYDREEKKLFLTRDRVGEKPLYYGMCKGSFLFASDIGSIKAVSYFDNQINPDILGLYFQHGYVPSPYSIYENIYKLEPGKVLTLNTRTLEYHTDEYFSMSETALSGQKHLFQGTEQEAADELEHLLMEAVKGQMISDVPLGAFLSGGIDSSLVVSLMQSASQIPVQTFTIGFDVEQYNEAKYASEIAAHLGTKHTELYVDKNAAFEVMQDVTKAFTEPFADSSQIPTMLVSRMTREHVTVSLSGDGGDELFCGYNSYCVAREEMRKLNSRFSYLPFGVKHTLGGAAGHFAGRKSNLLYKLNNYFTVQNEEEDHARIGLEDPRILYLPQKESRKGVRFGRHIILPDSNLKYQSGFLPGAENNLMLMDMLQYHPDDILVKVDRAGMLYSLETRIPMLDKDVIEFAWTLPLEYKWSDGVTKRVLRDILYRYVPREMIERPKKGFSVPLNQWMQHGNMRIWAEDILHDGCKIASDLINTQLAMQMWQEYTTQGKWSEKLWYILMLMQWLLSQNEK